MEVIDIDGELGLDIPDELLDNIGWQVGDVLVWNENEDGTWTLTKKESESE